MDLGRAFGTAKNAEYAETERTTFVPPFQGLGFF